MAATRKHYKERFKREAVRRVVKGEQRSEVVRDLGIASSIMTRWCRKYLAEETEKLKAQQDSARRAGAKRWHQDTDQPQEEAPEVTPTLGTVAANGNLLKVSTKGLLDEMKKQREDLDVAIQLMEQVYERV